MSDKKPEITPESGFDALHKLSWADFNLQLRAYESIIREVFEGAACPVSRSLVTVADADMWAFKFVLTVDPTAHVQVKTIHDYTSFFVLTDREASVRNTLSAWKVKSF